MIIRPATQKDVSTIHRLANEIWWPTYRGIVSDQQIAFMLEKMYSEEALKKQLGELSFLVVEQDHVPVAFAAYAPLQEENGIFQLHKIYILPSEQGKGTGKRFIGYVEETVKGLGANMLQLYVNRRNPAYNFYLKQGFELFETVDTAYYGYVLNDYLLRKPL